MSPQSPTPKKPLWLFCSTHYIGSFSSSSFSSSASAWEHPNLEVSDLWGLSPLLLLTKKSSDKTVDICLMLCYQIELRPWWAVEMWKEEQMVSSEFLDLWLNWKQGRGIFIHKYKRSHIKKIYSQSSESGKGWGDKAQIKVHKKLSCHCLREGICDNCCVVFTGNCTFLNLEIILQQKKKRDADLILLTFHYE